MREENVGTPVGSSLFKNERAAARESGLPPPAHALLRGSSFYFFFGCLHFPADVAVVLVPSLSIS